MPLLQHTRSSRRSCPCLAYTQPPQHNSVFAVPVLTCPRSGSGTQSQTRPGSSSSTASRVSSLARWWPLTLPASHPARRAATTLPQPRSATLILCSSQLSPLTAVGEPRGRTNSWVLPSPGAPPAHSLYPSRPYNRHVTHALGATNSVAADSCFSSSLHHHRLPHVLPRLSALDGSPKFANIRGAIFYPGHCGRTRHVHQTSVTVFATIITTTCITATTHTPSTYSHTTQSQA